MPTYDVSIEIGSGYKVELTDEQGNEVQIDSSHLALVGELAYEEVETPGFSFQLNGADRYVANGGEPTSLVLFLFDVEDGFRLDVKDEFDNEVAGAVKLYKRMDGGDRCFRLNGETICPPIM